MIRYHNFDIVFAEIPDETTLAINLTGCPNRCPGCHSPHLQADAGALLDDAALGALLVRYGGSITCVCFMGGDADPAGVVRLAEAVRRLAPSLRTGWYSGRGDLPEQIPPGAFDYIKSGPYVEALGPLGSPATNQRLYRIGPDGTRQDITPLLRR